MFFLRGDVSVTTTNVIIISPSDLIIGPYAYLIIRVTDSYHRDMNIMPWRSHDKRSSKLIDHEKQAICKWCLSEIRFLLIVRITFACQRGQTSK